MSRHLIIVGLLAGAACGEEEEIHDCDKFLQTCEDAMLVSLSDPTEEGIYDILVTPSEGDELSCYIDYQPQGRDDGDCGDLGGHFVSGGFILPVPGQPASAHVVVTHGNETLIDETVEPPYGPATDGDCTSDDCIQAVAELTLP